MQLETDLASALRERHGLNAVHDMGIVIVKGALLVDGFGDTAYPLPAVKPDLVLPDDKVAIELDLGGRLRSHEAPDTVAQDQHRDRALNDVGWRVLRIRQPGWPTEGSWPWRIETMSRSPRVLAE